MNDRRFSVYPRCGSPTVLTLKNAMMLQKDFGFEPKDGPICDSCLLDIDLDKETEEINLNWKLS